MKYLSMHPIDWVLHAAVCYLLIVFDLAAWPVVVLGALLLEYEQKTQVWYNNLTWWEYFKYHAGYDLFADAVGIIAGIIMIHRAV